MERTELTALIIELLCVDVRIGIVYISSSYTSKVVCIKLHESPIRHRAKGNQYKYMHYRICCA